MDKLLIISGPTGSGKTALAVKLAKRFNGHLISADSRQIYRGMDIGTGKDHPENVAIDLIDIIPPDKSFSVADYQRVAIPLITRIHRQGRLPIVVGGTMQYIQSLINPRTDTFSVRPNPVLRPILNRLSLSVLQMLLKLVNPQVSGQLNQSDKNNPRRLIRKIEISLTPKTRQPVLVPKFDYLHLSLTAPNPYLYQRIDARVRNRLEIGLLDEIQTLLTKYKWTDPGLNTLAYKQFFSHFQDPSPDTLNRSISQWKFDEHAYSRRQKTWLKKMDCVRFLDITDSGFRRQAVALVSGFLSE